MFEFCIQKMFCFWLQNDNKQIFLVPALSSSFLIPPPWKPLSGLWAAPEQSSSALKWRFRFSRPLQMGPAWASVTMIHWGLRDFIPGVVLLLPGRPFSAAPSFYWPTSTPLSAQYSLDVTCFRKPLFNPELGCSPTSMTLRTPYVWLAMGFTTLYRNYFLF